MKKSLAVVAALTATLSIAGLARAEPYTIFVYETAADLGLRAEASPRGQDYWAAWGRFAQVLTEAKAVRGGAPLRAAAQGQVFGVTPVASAAGPTLSGYFMIEAPDLAAASALAAQAPSAQRGGGAEVRAAYPAPTMSN